MHVGQPCHGTLGNGLTAAAYDAERIEVVLDTAAQGTGIFQQGSERDSVIDVRLNHGFFGTRDGQLDEPFDFFLRLTVGGSSVRRAAILAAFQVLRGVGIHREFLPNCIVVARRSR